jgi:hypothetical protein
MQTYGEAWYKMKRAVRVDGGKLVSEWPDKWPERMQRKEAAAYYNKKLIDYWAGMLDDRIPAAMRMRTVMYLMFGSKYR